LPRLAALCPRLEYLALQLDLALSGLAAGADGALDMVCAFPELLHLDIGIRDGDPRWIAEQQRYFSLFSDDPSAQFQSPWNRSAKRLHSCRLSRFVSPSWLMKA
jgi:hypothetical protein